MGRKVPQGQYSRLFDVRLGARYSADQSFNDAWFFDHREDVMGLIRDVKEGLADVSSYGVIVLFVEKEYQCSNQCEILLDEEDLMGFVYREIISDSSP